MEELIFKGLEKNSFRSYTSSYLFANLDNDDGFSTSLTSLREGCRRLKTVRKDGMFFKFRIQTFTRVQP